jgi:hypothetical protein
MNPARLILLQQWWLPLRWVGLTLSFMLALALAGSFVPYEAVLTDGHPWLPQKICSGCVFCGMTRSFCAMSAGRWGEAADWNPLGPLCYGLSWLWVVICLIIVAKITYGKVARAV